MRGAKSLVYAALLGRGWATLSAVSAASSVVLFAVGRVGRPGGRTTCTTSACGPTRERRAPRDRDRRHRRADLQRARRRRRPTAPRRSRATPTWWARPRRSPRARASSAASSRRRIQTPTGQMTRLTVTLQREASYRVVPDGTTLRVLLTPTGAAAPVAADDDPRSRRPPESTAIVHDVRFERSSVGLVELRERRHATASSSTSGASPPTRSCPRRRAGCGSSCAATALPDALARTLDVSAYRGALKSITASHDAERTRPSSRSTRSPRRPARSRSKAALLVWSFPVPKSSAQASPIARVHIDGKAVGKDGGAVRQVVTVAREPAAEDLPRIETSIHDEDPEVETSGGGAAGFASARRQRARAAALHRAAHRHRSQGRGHPQRPAAPGRHRSREHRHGRRRERHDHHPHAQRAVGPGARRRPPGQGPRHGAPGQPHPRRPARAAPEGAGAQARRSRSRSSSSRRSRRASSPSATRRPTSSQPRAKELLSPRGSIAVDERTNVLIARDIAGEPQLHRGARPLARHADRRRCSSRRASSRRRATTQRDVGIQWGGDATFSAGDRQPDGRRLPVERRRRRRQLRQQHADRRPLALHAQRRAPELRRQPPGRRRDRSRRRARHHARLDRQQLQPEPAPLGRRVERPRAHRERAARHGPRQPRSAHQPGHAHPVRAGQRARRADDVPGSQAAAPREAARHRRRLRLDAREAQPRRARLHPDQPATAIRRSSSARPRPTCS